MKAGEKGTRKERMLLKRKRRKWIKGKQGRI